MEQIAEAGLGGTPHKRVKTVVQTLATMRSPGESLAELAHDARNMVTALGLYCELLEEPGVLSAPYAHYGAELKLVAAASRRLVEKLVALDTRIPALPGEHAGSGEEGGLFAESAAAGRVSCSQNLNRALDRPIDDLREELQANRNLLAALAGPAITLTMEAEQGARPVALSGEDLTRMLVNLVKNAAESMAAAGSIRLTLRETLRRRPAEAGAAERTAATWLLLSVEDSGPGIPEGAADKIFGAGYSTRRESAKGNDGWPAAHRGLGLSITRSIIEAAGGQIHAGNGTRGGARFEIELPALTRRTWS